jgi:uncharacterized protein (TIGR03000 family)
MLSHTRLFQAAVVAAGIVAVGAADALARSHGSWGSYGSYGSSGSSASYGSSSSASYGSSSSASYGSSSSASYASSGSSGSSASYGRPGLFARWHARKAARASSGSSASYGTYYAYSSSGSSASYGSSSGSSGSYGGTYYSAPAGTEVAPADGAPAEPPAAPVDTAASISVKVPAEAVVFVNDRPTTSTGVERNFVSRGLAGGRTYAYQLRVEFNRDGEKVVENKLVRLQAGQAVELSFGGAQQVASGEKAATDLTLHVPAEAKVTLAGAATHQIGELRTFATDSLTRGQEWAGYVVRVELERDGKTLVEEKTLSIVGGENYELKFDFADGAAQVASLN